MDGFLHEEFKSRVEIDAVEMADREESVERMVLQRQGWQTKRALWR